jgi:hypothetical protein
VKQKSRIVSFEVGRANSGRVRPAGRWPTLSALNRSLCSNFQQYHLFRHLPRSMRAIESPRMHFFDALDLWFSPRNPLITEHRENVVVLSIHAGRVPLGICNRTCRLRAHQPDIAFLNEVKEFHTSQCASAPTKALAKGSGGRYKAWRQASRSQPLRPCSRLNYYSARRDILMTYTRANSRNRVPAPLCPGHLFRSSAVV